MTSNKRTLQLDKVNAKWLGVCAGIANFLEVQPWAVRLVFLGCMFFGAWVLVPGYFIAWYLMDGNTSKLRENLMENQTIKHFRSVDFRKKLYRDPANGKVWGICAGIADYLEVDATIVRVIFLFLAFLTGFPVLLYIGAYFVLEKKPVEQFRRSRRYQAESAERTAGMTGSAAGQSDFSERTTDEEAQRRRRRYSNDDEPVMRDQYSQRREFQYCARKFMSLHQRLARLEAYVTSPKFKLHGEFRSMS